MVHRNRRHALRGRSDTVINSLYCPIRFGCNGGRGTVAGAKDRFGMDPISLEEELLQCPNRFSAALLCASRRVALSALIAGPAFAQKTKLTVYTALENDQLGPYKEAFEKANPDVEIAWVRDSTGVVTARMLAEKDNPRADIIWGLGASSVALFDSMGLLEPYSPKGIAEVKPVFKSSKNPPAWTGMDAWLAVMCFNTVEGGKKNLPKPASWADLANPVYKDSIVMPNPASSGTGYQAVYAWIQMMGEKAGLGVHGQAPPEHRGLHALGLGALRAGGEGRAHHRHRLRHARRQGKDRRRADRHHHGEGRRAVGHGSHGDHEGHQEPRRRAEARRLRSQQAALTSSMASTTRSSATRGSMPAPPNYPPSADAAMAKIDLAKMGEERAKILAEWTKRYDGKSAPK